MDHLNGRKKWSPADRNIQVPLNVPAVKEVVPPQYEHYLHLLQERNRLMRRLQQKDKKEIDLEKKEKGFTIYLNSSFSGGRDTKARRDRRDRKHQTAIVADYLKGPKSTQFGVQSRNKLASKSKESRRNWQIGSVEFTTADGQRQRVKAPEHLSGKYTDDFESSSDSDDDNPTELIQSMSLLDVDDDITSSASLTTPRKHKTSYLKRVAAAKREEAESENRVIIKLEDVKKLRESLQMNKLIRHSLAMENNSEVEEEIMEEIIQVWQDESDGERVSPVIEEIEEEISSEDETREKGDTTSKRVNIFNPGSTLVLEFQPLPAKNVSKASRPLSANLRSLDSKTDSKEETSAVIRALQEENKKVEHFSNTRPLPPPKKTEALKTSPSPAKQTSPVKSSSDPDQTKSHKTTADTAKSRPALDGDPSINTVIERVLKMNPRQQKQLLQTLNHIDVDEKQIGINKTPLNTLVDSWASKAPVTDHFEVTLEIISNWGHPSNVGLTELEFFDKSCCLIPVKPTDVSVHGARGSSNKVDVLFNGKSKTTKERNMWNCKLDGQPIEFSISMANPNPEKQFELGSVKIWNWNNKMSNLDMGAREIRILFGGELLFSGEVDKGCGNQVFDYSKHIIFSNKDTAELSHAKKPLSRSGLSLNLDNPGQSKSVSASPRGPGRPLPLLTSPSRALKSPSKEDNHAAASSKSHHTFRSISRSSQSSASSSGSAKIKPKSDEKVDERQREDHIRSETRTLFHPIMLTSQHSVGTNLSSPEVNIPDSDVCQDTKRLINLQIDEEKTNK